MSAMHIAALLAVVAPVTAQMGPLSYIGCYKNPGSLGTGDTFQYQSDGHCQQVCVNNDKQAVLGMTNGNTCLCGGQTPNKSDLVDDSNCNSPCTGYGQHMCGGNGFYSVYLTGTQDNVGSVGGGSSSSGGKQQQPPPPSSSTTNSAPSVITSIAPGRTVVVTQSANADPSQPSPTPEQPASKPNTAAIAAGVVVGVVLIAALIGAVFFIRHRRKREAEEDYKQHQVADFMAASSKGSIPSRKPSGPDSRFDAEAMANRRLSDGSIADNEDYSRRILRVANPSDRE